MRHTGIPTQLRSFHVMAKPVGPLCNLDCTYCYYLEKESLHRPHEKWRMRDDVLESYIRQYIEQQDAPEVSFAWQGGEPTLLGVDFFRKVVELQKKYAGGKQVHNALQTNGTLLDEEWCSFLLANRFLIGLSIDGPRSLHDAYRVDKQQRGSFDRVMRGLELLKKHDVQFNTLTVVNRLNSHKALEVYRFLKRIGSQFLQFIPLVERVASPRAKGAGYRFEEPPVPGIAREPRSPVTPWSVAPAQYGEFLCTIFDEWVRCDVGRVFVQLFDVALEKWAGERDSLCSFAETCGRAMVLEHDGALYSCDHYVYPDRRLGNVMHEQLGDLASSAQQLRFGNAKRAALPRSCRECAVLFACNGECPKHRFVTGDEGEEGMNYLCAGYKRFFTHVDPYMRTMAGLLNRGRAPAQIMSMLAGVRPAQGRNNACRCGSGLKYKRCCGR